MNIVLLSIFKNVENVCFDFSNSPNAIFRNRRLEAPCESQSVSVEELELTILPELSDSESNDFNRAPPEPIPLSKRIRSVISLFAPKRKRKHARLAVSDTA